MHYELCINYYLCREITKPYMKQLMILDNDYLQWIKELFLSALPTLSGNCSTSWGAIYSTGC